MKIEPCATASQFWVFIMSRSSKRRPLWCLIILILFHCSRSAHHSFGLNLSVSVSTTFYDKFYRPFTSKKFVIFGLKYSWSQDLLSLFIVFLQSTRIKLTFIIIRWNRIDRINKKPLQRPMNIPMRFKSINYHITS